MKYKVTQKKPEKGLTKRIPSRGGRNSSGRITVRHRGGGARRKYRLVDFAQEKFGQKGKVAAVEYDPNRNAFISLVEYDDGSKGYQLASSVAKVGDVVECADKTEAVPGNRMRLANIPVGTPVFNIELVPGRGGRVARGAGTAARVMARDAGYVQLVMPSSEVRRVPAECFASVGEVSNPEHRFRRVGKAGAVRLKGRRPRVRGSAMNPVDHPHGGGEGRTGIGLKHPKTPWGKPALGVKTRKRKWTDKLIVQRRKKKR